MSKHAKGSVLFVDDEIVNTKVWVIYLERDGYEVTRCRYIEDLPDYLSERHYDVIILDVIMLQKLSAASEWTSPSQGDFDPTRAGMRLGVPPLRQRETPVIVLTNVPLNRIADEDLEGLNLIDKRHKISTRPSDLAKLIEEAIKSSPRRTLADDGD